MAPIHGDVTYCDYTGNMHYVRQGDFCKQCDRCWPGWGLAPFTERTFDFDPVHGALGCLHCTRCSSGFYSDKLSFDECLPCTDCGKEGRYETKKCMPKEDAVCGKVKQNIYGGSGYQQQIPLTPIISISVVAVVVIAVIVAFIVYRYLKNKRTEANRQEGTLKSSDASKGLLATESTDNSLLSSSKTTDSSVVSSSQDTLETDGSDQSFNSETTISIVEAFKDGHDCKIELSEAHARMISKYIAVENYFYDIALKLGVPDNDIKIIKENYKSDVKTQAYETLLKWKFLKASEATVLRFLNTLLQSGFEKVAVEFCNSYDQVTIQPSS